MNWPLNKICSTTTRELGSVPRVHIKTKSDKVSVMMLSDVHFGAEATNIELLDKHIALADELGAYFILVGDLFEVAIPSRIEESVWEQGIKTGDQFKMGLKYLYPRRDRVIFSVSGNHDARVWKKTGFDMSEFFAKDLGCFYNKNGGYVQVVVNDVEYTFAIFHGASSGMNPFTELERRFVVYDDADVIAMGNNHHLVTKALLKKRVIDGKESRRVVHFVRTGSYMTEPEYGRAQGYAPTLDGSPIVHLSGKTKNIFIDVAGETRWY